MESIDKPGASSLNWSTWEWGHPFQRSNTRPWGSKKGSLLSVQRGA